MCTCEFSITPPSDSVVVIEKVETNTYNDLFNRIIPSSLRITKAYVTNLLDNGDDNVIPQDHFAHSLNDSYL